MKETRVIGCCIKEISEILPVFSIEDNTKEYKINVGDTVYIQGSNPFWDEIEEFYIRLHTKTLTFNRTQLNEHFKITWESGCFNTCIRNGVPCKEISNIFMKGDDSLSYRRKTSCSIDYEIGRNECSRYSPYEKDSEENKKTVASSTV